MSAVSLEDVTLALGGRVVLSGISLEIADGEFVGVLGPNGAGKTTLMRAVLGLLRPRAGRLRVLGEAPRRGRADVGYMPQVRDLTPGLALRGRDFVASALDGHRWGLPWHGAEARREVARVLELVGAEPLAARPLGELSGGERQRLLLAQALLGQPRLLLLDEPLISLDPSRQESVVRLVRGLQQRCGLTVLFSAHELNPLLPAVDRVLYLGHGAAALGRGEEVITGPVLSRLYHAEIEVVRVGGRIFVMSGGCDVQHDAHRHGC